MFRARTCLLAVVVLALALAAPAVAAGPEGEAESVAPTPAAKGAAPEFRPVDPPAKVLEGLSGDREHPAPDKAPARIAVDGEPAGEIGERSFSTANEPFWSWGVTQNQSGLNCSIIGNPYYETQVTSNIGYGGTATVPRVGERFYIVLLYSHPGYACSGGFLADLYTELNLPAGTQMAVDAQNRIGCYTTTRANPDTWVDVTNSTWSSPNGTSGTWCKTDGATGMYGGINLGFRMLVTGTMFQIAVPVIATKELKGAANVPQVAEFKGTTDSVVTTSRLAYPKVWANVLNFFPASVAYPTPSATNVTNATAKTTAYVYNHFKTGNAYIDLGLTTNYGDTTQAIPLGANDAYTINTDWTELVPGRVYHWRARFVDANGNTTYGPDQTFRTAPGSTVTRSGAGLYVRAAGASTDDLRVAFEGGRYRFTNPASPLAPGDGCTAVNANEVTCDGAGVTRLRVDTGHRNDVITVAPSVTIATILNAGEGNDRITGGAGADVIDGGVGADMIIGGAGSDTATYESRTAAQPVEVSLDNQRNDGGAADVSGALKDDVRVERVSGGLGADTLVGNDSANILTGGGGADTLEARGGADRVGADDDEVDASIDCGAGSDRATVDATPADPAATACESVTRV